ncbi:hypothetical protein OHA98_21280 [Streptomyces sp. NBC_00654]|uniref:hypothetical protein n=1 Tax=Streptomyces sp. NBC_00654 TaxID=2975799 RepID=UPI0022531FB0|nr:hypothetical protein [Streptomyces sp. NBC_00654]MCX4967252.1 hypothetical protein [Streptomyces sp. NBC_00654]
MGPITADRSPCSRSPEITAVSIDLSDFSVTLNGSTFDARAVAGHGMTRTSISSAFGRSRPATPLSWISPPSFPLSS